MTHEKCMERCIQLAQLGLGSVAPNPMVGCVIVHNEKIIGEGYHRKFGEAHAEVNVITSVKDVSLLTHSTLYVNLEPCVHYGKTPPCADLIIYKKIPKVVIGCTDPFEKVSGKGIQKLKDAGIEVITNVLEKKSLQLNRRFFTYHIKKRPYIILKWAQSADGFIASKNGNQKSNVKWISNSLSRTLTHKWRTEEQAIMVGTNTALCDNPQLTARLWQGKSPLRIVIDKNRKLPVDLNLFKKDVPTVVFTSEILKPPFSPDSYREGDRGEEKSSSENLQFIKINFEDALNEILKHLYEMEIQSVIVEGGSALLNSFIKENLWDEARIFTSDKRIGEGVAAPYIQGNIAARQKLENDLLVYIENTVIS